VVHVQENQNLRIRLADVYDCISQSIQFETDREWESLFTSEYRLQFRSWLQLGNCADKYELVPIGVVTLKLGYLLVQIRFERERRIFAGS
jgi:hypothetical protein